jgi:hypothetical protein
MVSGLLQNIPFISGGIGNPAIKLMAVWTIIIVTLIVMGFSLFFIILWHLKSTKVIEIDNETKRVRILSGRYKKKKDGSESFWIGRLKKHLPRPQQKDIYLKGKQDALVLLKDNNGLHHTLRLPDYDLVKEFYKKAYNKDITNPDTRMHDLFFLPNPHEDINWLAQQIGEAKKEFGAVHWWQHPNLMVVGTAFVCCIMFIVTVVLLR